MVSGTAAPIHVGATAPELLLQDMNGKAVPLSAMRGRNVLLDFWASWCAPCRAVFQKTILPLYEQFRPKGLEVLCISLDRNKEAWLKAVAQEQLIHVSDLKGAASPVMETYNVPALPYNCVVDPNGVIVAVNLHDAALTTFIAGLYR